MNILGHLGYGSVFGITEHAGYLYAGTGTELRIWNSRTAITRTNYIGIVDVGEAIKSLKVHNGRLFVLTAKTLFMYDISNPVRPIRLSRYDYTEGRLYEHTGLSLKDNYVFISSYDVGIIIVRIDTTQFIHVKKLALRDATRTENEYWAAEANRPRRSVISGNNLIFGTQELGGSIFIVDISNPETAFIDTSMIWTSSTPRAHISGVASANGYIYAIEYHNGLRVFDSNLNEVNNTYLDLSGTGVYNYNDIQIVGTRAYVSVRYGAYDIFDISNPVNPVRVGIFTTPVPGYNEDIFVSNNVYIAADTYGFSVFSLSNTLKAQVPVIGGARSFAIQEDRLFVGGQNGGAWMVSLANPLAPVELDNIFNSGRVEMMQVDGNQLWVPGDWTFAIYDISNPLKMVELVYRKDKDVSHVLKEGNIVYMMHYQSETFGVYDYTNILAPLKISETAIGFAGKMIRYGSYLLACGQFGSLMGLHVIDPNTSQVMATFAPGMKIDDIAMIGNTCYVVGGNEIYSVDMTNPLSPVPLHNLNYTGEWFGRSIIAVPELNLIFAGGGSGLGGVVKRIDVSNHARMVWTEDIEFPEIVEGLLFDPHSGYIFVADYNSGIFVIDTHLGTTPYKFNCINGVCVPGDTGEFNSRQECLDSGCAIIPPPPPPPPPQESYAWFYWMLGLIAMRKGYLYLRDR